MMASHRFSRFFVLILIMDFFILQNFPAAEEGPQEKYTYEAVPEGGKASRKERIEATVHHSDGRIISMVKTFRPGSEEIIKIETLPDGTFLTGSRTVLDENRENPDMVEIVRKKQTVRVAYMKKGRKKFKEYKLSGDKLLAVDVSLLILLRFFPFDQEITWDIFMVDFSRHSVSIDIRQDGIEKVVVPAGKFECYRMEATLKIFIFRPKMIYWIAREKPHFLVQHTGKRGPFTPHYITSLVSVDE